MQHLFAEMIKNLLRHYKTPILILICLAGAIVGGRLSQVTADSLDTHFKPLTSLADGVNQLKPSRRNQGKGMQPGSDNKKGVFPAVQLLLKNDNGSSNHLTVTADMRGIHSAFANVAEAMERMVGGAGLFHVSIGDIDGTIPENREVIDTTLGEDTIRIPGIGNHEAETGADMEWLRNEFNNGHALRTPLRLFTNNDGPLGSKATTYSWDNAATNTHFIMLNLYWNGGTAEGTGNSLSGDDTATDGDVNQELRDWLEADLISSQDKVIFVFGHEPAFPENRHVGESLDKYETNRDLFWALLEQYGVEAYICGHTHFFSTHQGDKSGVGSVWQIDVGNAGNDDTDGQTFLNITLLDGRVRYDVYRNIGGWHLARSWNESANSKAGLARSSHH